MTDQERGNEAAESGSPLRLLATPADGLEYYLKPSLQTIEECSVYRLLPVERFLLEKYCRGKGPVLDIACGLGRTTLCISEMGIPVIGMDFSAGLIDVAKRRFPYLDLRVGSLTDTGLPQASMTSIFVSAQAIDMLTPISNRIKGLNELARVLQPGGILIYSSTNVKCLHFLSPRYWRTPVWKLRHTLKAFGEFAAVSDEGIQGIYAAPNAVIAQTEKSGFRFLEIRGPDLSTGSLRNRFTARHIYYAFEKA